MTSSTIPKTAWRKFTSYCGKVHFNKFQVSSLFSFFNTSLLIFTLTKKIKILFEITNFIEGRITEISRMRFNELWHWMMITERSKQIVNKLLK